MNGQNVVFDYEYYAANNLDVAAVFGMDQNALTQHYITCGINEGRPAYAPGTDVAALLGVDLQANTEAVAAPAASWDWITVDPQMIIGLTGYVQGNISTKKNAPGSVAEAKNQRNRDMVDKGSAEAQAAVMAQQISLGTPTGEFITDMWEYRPSWTYELDGHSYNFIYNMRYEISTITLAHKGLYENRMMITFGERVANGAGRAGDILYNMPQNFPMLQSYCTPDYEWRAIAIRVSGGSYANGWWSDASADNSSNWRAIDSPFQNAYQFTITQDGVAYPECKMFTCVDDSVGVTDADSKGVICMLVPKGYTGNAYCHIYGGKLENRNSVQDTSRKITMVLPKKATEAMFQGWINMISN